MRQKACQLSRNFIIDTMGNFLSQLFDRLFDYPLKRRRFCVYRKEDYSVTGKFVGFNAEEQDLASSNQSNYEKLVKEFNEKLLEKRKENFSRKRRGGEDETLLRQFPGWTGTTISYLHSLFMTFCDEERKRLEFKGFECILECLGDENHNDVRKIRFNYVDRDRDGFIDYTNFLYILYHFDTPLKESAIGLAKLCVNAAERTQHVNSLSIAKQLEYGLF